MLIPIVLLLGLAVGLFGWRTNFSFDPTHLLTAPQPTATGGSRPPSPPAESTNRADEVEEAADALESCRERVQAGAAVIKAAETGVGNWSDHVEAQTKANRDRITVTMLDKVFAETRDAGPEDQRRYAKARKAYRAADASCEPVPAAPEDQAADLASCRERAEVQERVVRAAQPAMNDWKAHLEQMERSERNPSPDDQEDWLRAWRAAPPNIKAFNRALEKFEQDESRCAD